MNDNEERGAWSYLAGGLGLTVSEIEEGFRVLELESGQQRFSLQHLHDLMRPPKPRPQKSVTAAHTEEGEASEPDANWNEVLNEVEAAGGAERGRLLLRLAPNGP